MTADPAGTDHEGSPTGRRWPATVTETKALAHPLRLRILRLCINHELTNKQLADRLGRDPGTVLYHVRKLVDAGFLVAIAARTGDSGALEKPYRSTGLSWWLSMGVAGDDADMMAPLDAFLEELAEGGPAAIAELNRFTLHLSEEQLGDLSARIMEILDEYVDSDPQRSDECPYGGIFVLHRLPD